MTVDELTKQLGNVFIYGVPSVGIAWLFLQKAAERWVDAHFAKRQKAFEHEQAKELQRIKAKLDTVIQGSLKLQEREFKIIPEAWEHIGQAYGVASWLCSPMQTYASLEYMTPGDLDEFLSKKEWLTTGQKNQIRDLSGHSRDTRWQELDTGYRYNQARNALAEADKFLKANSIFIPDALREQFDAQVAIIWDALISFDSGSFLGSKEYSLIKQAWEKLKVEGGPLHKEIEKAVRKRLLEQSQVADE